MDAWPDLFGAACFLIQSRNALARFQSCTHVFQADAFRPQSDQDVVEQIGGFGGAFIFSLRCKREGKFSAFFGDFLAAMQRAFFEQALRLRALSIAIRARVNRHRQIAEHIHQAVRSSEWRV